MTPIVQSAVDNALGGVSCNPSIKRYAQYAYDGWLGVYKDNTKKRDC